MQKTTALSANHRESLTSSIFPARQRLEVVFLCLTTIFMECLCYFVVVSPLYSYERLTITFNIVKMVEAVVCVIGAACFLPRRVRQPSDFFQHLLFLFPLSGMSVLYFVQDLPRFYYYLSVFCFFIVLAITKLVSFERLRLPPGSPSIALFVLLSLLCIGVLNLILSGAWHHFNLDIFKVYETRSATAEMVGSGILGYLSPWAFGIAGPCLFMISLDRRKYTAAIVLFFIQLFIYSAVGHKQYLTVMLFLLILYYCVLRGNYVSRLYVFVLLLIGIAILEWVVLGSYLITGVVVRRKFFIPAFLNYGYYSTAEQYGYAWWADSFLHSFIPYNWSTGISRAVSYYLWGHAKTDENTGFLGSGYLQAGVFGMVMYSAMIGALLRVCDAVIITRMSGRFGIAVATPSIMVALDSSDLPVAFLTHGLGLLILILWLLGGSDYMRRPLIPDRGVSKQVSIKPYV